MCFYFRRRNKLKKNLIKRSRNYNFPIKICLVVSNKANARGLNYAKKYSIPFLIINTKNRNYENLILNNFNRYQIELICLAGYMKIISKNFLRKCKKKRLSIFIRLYSQNSKDLIHSKEFWKINKENWMHCSLCQ